MDNGMKSLVKEACKRLLDITKGSFPAHSPWYVKPWEDKGFDQPDRIAELVYAFEHDVKQEDRPSSVVKLKDAGFFAGYLLGVAEAADVTVLELLDGLLDEHDFDELFGRAPKRPAPKRPAAKRPPKR